MRLPGVLLRRREPGPRRLRAHPSRVKGASRRFAMACRPPLDPRVSMRPLAGLWAGQGPARSNAAAQTKQAIRGKCPGQGTHGNVSRPKHAPDRSKPGQSADIPDPREWIEVAAPDRRPRGFQPVVGRRRRGGVRVDECGGYAPFAVGLAVLDRSKSRRSDIVRYFDPRNPPRRISSAASVVWLSIILTHAPIGVTRTARAA